MAMTATIRPSTRSSSPPWPGIRSPESLTPKRRFRMDSNMSPPMVARPPNRLSLAVESSAVSIAAPIAPKRPPANPAQVLFGEYRGQSLGPFRALPAKNAQMSADQTTANNKIVQLIGLGMARIQLRARQGA